MKTQMNIFYFRVFKENPGTGPVNNIVLSRVYRMQDLVSVLLRAKLKYRLFSIFTEDNDAKFSRTDHRVLSRES